MQSEKDIGAQKRKLANYAGEIQTLVPRVENFKKKLEMANRLKLIEKKRAIVVGYCRYLTDSIMSWKGYSTISAAEKMES